MVMATYIDDLEWEIKKLREENDNLLQLVWEKRFREMHLEEENKKLKEKYDWLWKIYTEDVNERVEENKKLNLQIAELMWERDWKQMKIERLEERIKEHVPTQILADFRNRFKE